MTAGFKDAALSYEMDGKRYAFSIRAESLEDAERRMRAIRSTGKVDGWPCYSVKLPSPVAYAALPFAPLVCWFLNLFHRRPQ
jgi:hypothetical protein